MPVPAVMRGGMPTVSSGSQMTILGIIFGWKITFLVWVASSVMTPARPTSEPVPAVVGTATIGAMLVGSARVHQSPTILEIPHRPRLPRHEGDQLADVEARAAAEGDDAVMPPARKAATPASTLAASDWVDVGEHRRHARILEELQRLRRDRQADQPGIGDEQRPIDAGALQRLGSSA
jgi:hypothetical protein